MADPRSRLLAPPRIRALEEGEDERRATWLELFFDLVFVVAVAQLAFALGADKTVEGFLIFLGLFVPVWWAWVGYTFYADRFDTDDVVHRVLMLSGMFAVGALASVIPDAARGETAGFAIAYVAVRAFVILLNARAWLHLPSARPLLDRYVPAFTLAAALMLASVAVEPPLRYWIWALALAIDVGTPLASRARIAQVPVHASHIPERVGLFTIIVLGETVLAVVLGTDAVDWNLESGLVAALGFMLGVAFWWLYFDYLDGEMLLGRSIWAGQAYLYSHVPLMAGVIALGVGVKDAIQETAGTELSESTRWILCGGVAVAFGALAAIHLVSSRSPRDVDLLLRLGVALVALGIACGGGGLAPLPVVAVLVGAVVGAVALELAMHHRHADEVGTATPAEPA
ncbi:MAG: low temperature requirement protein A [Candidatus Limnocylindria bacterium]